MKLTAEIIREKYDPCESGIGNFERNHPNFKGSLEDILALENVSYDDKLWLAIREASPADLKQWAVECSEYVLDVYETAYPDDSRVRDSLEVTKRYLTGEASLEELKDAESAALYAATYAARDARSAAMYAAWSEQEDINLSLLIAIVSNKV